MTEPELPTIPVHARVIEYTEYNVDKDCDHCGGVAEYYVIVTNERANRELGTDLAYDDWPVNSRLCSDCFSEAPRVKSIEDIVDVPEAEA